MVGRFSLMKSLVLPIALALAFSVGCGGKSEAPPPSSPTPAASGEPADATGDLDSAKAAFVTSCSKNEPGTEAYCGCAWDVARAHYGDAAVRAKGTPTEDDLAKIHLKVGTACASHFPPDVIERAFMAGCTKKQADLQQYCACTWTELAKRIPPAELVTERAKNSERYHTAVQGSAKQCGRLRSAH
jgi:hypothetical protein